MPLAGRITEHFSWSEATITEHRTLAEANRTSLENSPAIQEAVRALCSTLLEPIRARWNKPVMVHSMYRCATLNNAIGGSSSSQHMKGEACDFHVAGVSLQDVFDWIRNESNLPYGQVILEGRVPSWVHISLGEPWRARERSRQALRWDGKTYSVVS